MTATGLVSRSSRKNDRIAFQSSHQQTVLWACLSSFALFSVLFSGFVCKPGESLFVLADISKTDISGVHDLRCCLGLYTSPSSKLMDKQRLKESTARLGCPLPVQEEILRYSNKVRESRCDNFGSLTRVVWGSQLTRKIICRG